MQNGKKCIHFYVFMEKLFSRDKKKKQLFRVILENDCLKNIVMLPVTLSKINKPTTLLKICLGQHFQRTLVNPCFWIGCTVQKQSPGGVL